MKQLRGVAAAPGYAIGPVLQFRPAHLLVERTRVANTQEEQARLTAAVSEGVRQLAAAIETARGNRAPEVAAILEAHLLMLQDPELLTTSHALIQAEGINAEFAFQQATEKYAQKLEGMQDPYFKARAADVRDVARRLLHILLHVESADLGTLAKPSIIVAQDLAPSETVTMDKEKVLGICTVDGSETSHTAILARGLGIPAVVGVGADVLAVPDGTEIVLDGTGGELILEPDKSQREGYDVRRLNLKADRDGGLARCQEPAVTLDGRRVEVVCNIGSLDGARTARSRGAEGVGLLRTEFLYMDRTSLPSEDDQYEIYRDVFAEFHGLPIVLRTIDIGGDKPLPYLELKPELNPFLGVRGIRLSLSRPDDLFKPQLRAALRAGAGHDLRIMFPMVATVGEIRAARATLDTCRAELMHEGKPIAETLQVGIMVEVPAVAVMADVFASEVDFFSIGTNDLTQYVLAADRTNANVAGLASPFSPAVLRLIQNVITEGHKHGKWVGVCGELAGEPLAIPILLGLGLDEFSMNPQAIPAAKQTIRGLSARECAPLAEAALGLASADDVKAFVTAKLPPLAPG